MQISYDDGNTWSDDCSVSVQKHITTAIWQSSSIYHKESNDPVHYSVICTWYLGKNVTEVCEAIDVAQYCMTPVSAIYSSTIASVNASSLCDGLNEQNDFSHYREKAKIDWAVPDKIYKSGSRTNLKLFGKLFPVSGNCLFEVESGEIFTTSLIPSYNEDGSLDSGYSE